MLDREISGAECVCQMRARWEDSKSSILVVTEQLERAKLASQKADFPPAVSASRFLAQGQIGNCSRFQIWQIEREPVALASTS
jgi:hypothetical protein